MVGGSVVVEDILLWSFTTLGAFFLLLALARHKKIFLASLGVIDLISVVTAHMGCHHLFGSQNFSHSGVRNS